jgi:uncharacterized protein (TIGR02118 family)
MIVVTVIYPKYESSRFDVDYYLATHIPLVREKFEPHGMKNVRVMRGMESIDGSAPAFAIIGELEFSSLQAFRHALAMAGEEVVKDVPNFTNIQPMIQINELM